MKKPIQTYRLWNSNRAGSTFLCQLLEKLGYAGVPGEHFALHGKASLKEKYSINTYDELVHKVWELGSSPNGIFADKAGAHFHYHKQVVEEISNLKHVPLPESYEDIWRDIFPNCKHVLIMRINRIRQAVSWWKAIQDNQWHLYGDQTYEQDESYYDDKYNLDALKHLYNEAMLRDIANQEYLVRNGLKFITVTYEALATNTLFELNRVLDHVGLPKADVVPQISIKKTTNRINEIWAERFKDDLQKNMEPKVFG